MFDEGAELGCRRETAEAYPAIGQLLLVVHPRTLNPKQILLGAEGWTRDLLRSPV